MRVVLLNGPKGVGKDYIADHYTDHLAEGDTARVLPLMWPVKIEALREAGLHPALVHELEKRKDEPAPELGGKTPRQLYIEYGQLKRKEYGQNYIANLWLRKASDMRYDMIIVPDVRFQPEVSAAIRLVGSRNVLLVHVHRGSITWEGDIGSYLEHETSCALHNDFKMLDPGEVLHEIVKEWRTHAA